MNKTITKKIQPRQDKVNIKNVLGNKALKGVIFDLDGTLVDNMPFHKIAWQKVLNNYSISFSDENFQTMISGKDTNYIFDTFFISEVSGEEKKKIVIEKEETYRELYSSSIKEVNGLSKLLDRLKARGIKIGLATTTSEENTFMLLDRLGVTNYFDSIVHRGSVAKIKPHPEVYTKSLENMNINADETIVFEDSISGINAAISAGIKTIGLLTTQQEKMNGTVASIKTYDDILF